MAYGMTDTIGYKAAKAINANVTNSLVDNLVNQYAWYKVNGEYGAVDVKQVNNTCCLGYEDIFGNKYDMMDNVDLPNDSGNVGKWRIWMPDGTTRMVKGTTNSTWVASVYHGKYMDVVPVGNVGGSSSTYYSDYYGISTAASRVVYRGCSYAGASGGVVGAYAYIDVAYAYAYVGSRLVFHGQIVWAQSVSAFKSISEVA